MDTVTLKKHLIEDEGRRSKPYADSLGVLTIGVGINLEAGLRDHEIEFLLLSRIEEVEKDLKTFPWWAGLNEARQVALANMRYQLGPSRFRGFKKMLQAIAEGNWERAAEEAKDSLWFAQTQKSRTMRVIHTLRYGTYL